MIAAPFGCEPIQRLIQVSEAILCPSQNSPKKRLGRVFGPQTGYVQAFLLLLSPLLPSTKTGSRSGSYNCRLQPIFQNHIILPTDTTLLLLTRKHPLKPSLDQVCNVAGKLLNNSVVEALDILKHALVIFGDEVDGYSLPSKPPRAPNPVEVVLGLGGQVIVDDQRHLGRQHTQMLDNTKEAEAWTINQREGDKPNTSMLP
jgi:hypothetical protein